MLSGKLWWSIALVGLKVSLLCKNIVSLHLKSSRNGLLLFNIFPQSDSDYYNHRVCNAVRKWDQFPERLACRFLWLTSGQSTRRIFTWPLEGATSLYGVWNWSKRTIIFWSQFWASAVCECVSAIMFSLYCLVLQFIVPDEACAQFYRPISSSIKAESWLKFVISCCSNAILRSHPNLRNLPFHPLYS